MSKVVSCEAKVRYRTYFAANQKIKQLGKGRKRDGHPLGNKLAPYRCSNCQGWHIGHYIQD